MAAKNEDRPQEDRPMCFAMESFACTHEGCARAHAKIAFLQRQIERQRDAYLEAIEHKNNMLDRAIGAIKDKDALNWIELKAARDLEARL